MKTTIFGLCLLFLPFLLPAQRYTDNFNQEYFFGPLPSVRSESMGHTGVAIGNSVSGLFINPAVLGTIDDLEIDIATTAPFYVLKESDYYFLGGAYRIHPKLVAAASFHQFAMGPTGFVIEINGEDYPVDAPKATNLALSVAASPIENLQIGLNLNHFRWKYIDEVPVAGSLFFDAGVLYTLPIKESETSGSRLKIGGSLINFAKDKITFASPMGDEASNHFPIIGRIGVAYEGETTINYPGAGEGKIGIVLTAEYHGLLNNDYRKGIQMGGEVVFREILAVRVGYLSLNNNDNGLPQYNFSRGKDFTYGFGFIVPLDQLTDKKFPWKLHIDYVSLEPVILSTLGGRLPNRRGFSFRLVRNLSNS